MAFQVLPLGPGFSFHDPVYTHKSFHSIIRCFLVWSAQVLCMRICTNIRIRSNVNTYTLLQLAAWEFFEARQLASAGVLYLH